jgi:hypothetical protein
LGVGVGGAGVAVGGTGVGVAGSDVGVAVGGGCVGLVVGCSASEVGWSTSDVGSGKGGRVSVGCGGVVGLGIGVAVSVGKGLTVGAKTVKVGAMVGSGVEVGGGPKTSLLAAGTFLITQMLAIPAASTQATIHTTPTTINTVLRLFIDFLSREASWLPVAVILRFPDRQLYHGARARATGAGP